MTGLIGLLVGFVFGLGLLISGMTNPAKIIAFLDVAGTWDPSLMIVMAAAVGVAAPAFAYVRRQGRSLFGEPIQLPRRSPITPRLLLGSALFGAGWGFSGFCPGPAVVALSSGDSRVLAFVAAMLGGLALSNWIRTRRPPRVEAPAAFRTDWAVPGSASGNDYGRSRASRRVVR